MEKHRLREGWLQIPPAAGFGAGVDLGTRSSVWDRQCGDDQGRLWICGLRTAEERAVPLVRTADVTGFEERIMKKPG